MRYDKLIEELQNLIGYKPPARVITQVLGFSSTKVYYTRAQRNSEFSDLEVKTLFEYFDPNRVVNSSTLADKVELHYYTNPNLKTKLTVPDVTTVWQDRQIIENIWKRKPENLKVITMLGDKMDYGAYPLRIDDILLIDTADTDVTKSGVYAFTTQNGAYMFINGITRKFDNTYRFFFYNPMYPEKVLTAEDVEKADIQIVGRIFKNLSLTI